MKHKFLVNLLHTEGRLKERYHITLSWLDQLEIADMIQRSSGKFLEKKMSNSRSIHVVPFKGKSIRCVYDKNQHNIVTVLPLENTPPV